MRNIYIYFTNFVKLFDLCRKLRYSAFERRRDMALTNIGKFLRKLRIDKGELLKDMAEKLNISVSMLSGIETGTRTLNKEKYFDAIIKEYSLDEAAIQELDNAIEQSAKNINIELNNTTSAQKDLVFSLARVIETLSTKDIDAIMSVIGDKKND